MKGKGTIRRRSERGRNRKEEGEVKEKELGTYSHIGFFSFLHSFQTKSCEIHGLTELKIIYIGNRKILDNKSVWDVIKW